MNTSSNVLISTAVIALLAAAGSAEAFTAPHFKGSDSSIPSPGYPDFWSLNFSASLTKNASGTVYTLSISGSDPNVGIFNFPGAAYLVGNERVSLTAHFDSTGHLLTSLANTYEVDGSLPAWGNPTFGTKPAGVNWAAQPIEKLFSANLTAVTVDATDQALGFKTGSFSGWANQRQLTTGSTTESVWLYSLLSSPVDADFASAAAYTFRSDWNSFLAEVRNHTALKADTFYGIASIATVPLPAALWLLASGAAGLGGFARRRQAGKTV